MGGDIPVGCKGQAEEDQISEERGQQGAEPDPPARQARVQRGMKQNGQQEDAKCGPVVLQTRR